MKSFSIENIKSFKNLTEIELKPITILVGKNSCGKSSLIRFPVVLAQTCDLNTATLPLQLYGKMIDYGTYNDVVFNHQDNEIAFSFKYDMPINTSIIGNYTRAINSEPDIRQIEVETHLNMIKEHISVTTL